MSEPVTAVTCGFAHAAFLTPHVACRAEHVPVMHASVARGAQRQRSGLLTPDRRRQTWRDRGHARRRNDLTSSIDSSNLACATAQVR
jgi:hypothetical protein